MALMMPNTLREISSATVGEKRVFNYLSNLPGHYYVWFDLGISNIEVYPDFIILVPNKGIIVLEVKDWSLKNIRSFNKERINLKNISVKNPIIRSREYIELILKELNKSKYLKDKNGNLLFEWQYGVVFSNIKRKDFLGFDIGGVKIESIMTEKRIIFSDDLSDSSQKAVEKQINNFFESKTKMMTNAQFYTVKRIICPETEINGKQISVNHINEKVHLDAILDNPQEMVAKSIGEGRRLLHGIAGSGKTLIMLFRAKLITIMHPDWKVLLLCWNISLKKYMEKMFESINIQGDFRNVEIEHFTNFLRKKYRKFLHKNLPSFTKLSEKNAELVRLNAINEFLQEVKVSADEMYQGIFIDEAQDFKGEYFWFINEFMDPRTNSMLVCADEAQNIMKRQWDFKEMEVINFSDYINLEDNYSLSKNYRNTVEILKFAAYIYDKKLPVRKSDNKIYQEGKIHGSNIHDVKPILNSFKSDDDQYHSVANWILELMKENDDLNFGDFMVIFPGAKWKKYAMIEETFNFYNIPFYSLAKNLSNKSNFDATTNEVKISTIASSKGMDFKAVALVNAEDVDNKFDDKKSMLYTAVTRAREKLYIAVDDHSPICSFLFNVYNKAFGEEVV